MKLSQPTLKFFFSSSQTNTTCSPKTCNKNAVEKPSCESNAKVECNSGDVTPENVITSVPSQREHTTQNDQLCFNRKRLKRCVILSEDDEELSVDQLSLMSRERNNACVQKHETPIQDTLVNEKHYPKSDSITPVIKEQFKVETISPIASTPEWQRKDCCVVLTNEELSEKENETENTQAIQTDPLWLKGQAKVKKEYQLFHKHIANIAKNRTKQMYDVNWLKSLPIAWSSIYFQEYIDAVERGVKDVTECAFNNEKKKSMTVCHFPSWILPENLRDIHKNRPDSSEYDVTSVWIPEEKLMRQEPKHSTPAMLQYWNLKREHFDKIVFFKFGKFYELFYIDAFIGNKFCNLRWIGSDEKPHVGFPETSLHTYAQKMVNEGFKVVVVEQMETPKEMNLRNQNASTGNKVKTVKREICDVFSIGTLLHEAMLPNDSRLLLSIYYNTKKSSFGFVYTDVSTCEIWIGNWKPIEKNTPTSQQFQGILSPVSQSFRTLLNRILPVEVIFDHLNLPSHELAYLKLLPLPPHLNSLKLRPLDDSQFTTDALKLVENQACYPNRNVTVHESNLNVLTYLRESQETLHAFTLLCRYLNSVLLLEKVLTFSRFQMDSHLCAHESQNFYKRLPSSTKQEIQLENGRQRLIIDSVALRHLNVLQGTDGTLNFTLFQYVNRTVTPMGVRLLKKWLAAPLVVPEDIIQRLACTTWFVNNPSQLHAIRSDFSKLGDIERKLTRFCTRSLQQFRTAVYFDDIHSKYFRQFVEMLNGFSRIHSCLMTNINTKDALLPCRLKTLCSFANLIESSDQDENSSHLFDDMRNCLILNTETNEWNIAPNVDDAYDAAFKTVQDIELSLNKYLKNLMENAKRSNCITNYHEIQYTHSKFPYEIEIPEGDLFIKFIQSRDETAQTVTSSRKGYIRLRTTEILDFVTQLETSQVFLKDVLYGCQKRLFTKFYNHYYDLVFSMLHCVAEIDIYAGFATLALIGTSSSVSVSEHMCCPQIVARQSDVQPILRMINSRHPLIPLNLPPGTQCVTNNICLNDPNDPEGLHSFFLITGPNMGGKSTLLRQVCLSVILAQIGSYVPATECTLVPVDRIFTRLGAYDAILEGRSAFLVELEETIPAAHTSTEYSLVVLDEFGRGTSSCDGAALGLALAEHLARIKKTRCLFSTHFQLLADELVSIPSVRCVHMAVKFDVNTASLTFLYKLTLKACSRSHGIHVARLAGIPEEIISAASEYYQDISNNSSRHLKFLRLKNLASKVVDSCSPCATNTAILKSLRSEFFSIVSTLHPPDGTTH
ncbi:DNA mismatch repair protein Msh6-like [Hylaeus volcanicus]|uniref:DNA mismatch repair protein Msh6-like n=1 Tax=Hylaeus volcanicus TaxID=313075 RepID=UPI0023B82945|nr:DNA mismatch repair protein Msh6-like [Hylaeus volcanicus]